VGSKNVSMLTDIVKEDEPFGRLKQKGNSRILVTENGERI
jgi:hypothetical protein